MLLLYLAVVCHEKSFRDIIRVTSPGKTNLVINILLSCLAMGKKFKRRLSYLQCVVKIHYFVTCVWC